MLKDFQESFAHFLNKKEGITALFFITGLGKMYY